MAGDSVHLESGDLIRLRRGYAPYYAHDRLNTTMRPIGEGDVCIWIGKDPDLRGRRSFPRIIMGEHLVEVQGEGIFEVVVEPG